MYALRAQAAAGLVTIKSTPLLRRMFSRELDRCGGSGVSSQYVISFSVSDSVTASYMICPAWVYISIPHSLWHCFIFLFSTVNPCCYLPCQHWGVCVRYGEAKYECDCTRTGYYGENCTVRESGSHILPSYCTFKEFELFFCTWGWKG